MLKLPLAQGTNLTMNDQSLHLKIKIGGIDVGSISGKIGDADSGSFSVARSMVHLYKKATQGPRSLVGNSDLERRLRLDVLSIVASAACCEHPSTARLERNAFSV